MIDNAKQVVALMKAIKENLPIPLLPTKQLQQIIQRNKISYPKGYQFQIEEVLTSVTKPGLPATSRLRKAQAVLC